MPIFPTRIVQPMSGDIGDPRANHSVRPASGHPVRNEPAKTRRAALGATAPATSYYPTRRRLPGLIHDVRLTVTEGGPHAIPWTHADQVNTALLGFIRS
jgi:pimeloyl-ACP methyl ester carboxylesterase